MEHDQHPRDHRHHRGPRQRSLPRSPTSSSAPTGATGASTASAPRGRGPVTTPTPAGSPTSSPPSPARPTAEPARPRSSVRRLSPDGRGATRRRDRPGRPRHTARTSSRARAATVAPRSIESPVGTEAGSSGAATAGAGSAGGSCGANCCSRHSTNCWSILSETSCMTPLPNCAGLPVTDRSVPTSTRVPSPSGASSIVTVAPAVPLPRWSLPFASRTARYADVVALDERAGPGVLEGDRPELDLHRPGEPVVAGVGDQRHRGSRSPPARGP